MTNAAQITTKFAEYKNIWVFIETHEGSALSVGLELLSPARRLADLRGSKLVAVILGVDNAQAIKSAAQHGADEVVSVEGPQFAAYNTDAFTDAMTAVVQKYLPEALLISATDLGCDFAPRLNCRLNTGLVAHCTSLDIDNATGDIVWTRPAFGSKLMANILIPNHRPQIGTIKPGIFKKPELLAEKTCPVTTERPVLSSPVGRVRLIESIRQAVDAAVNLEGAQIIVAAGMGTDGPEGIALVKALAEALGGVVGATRPVADAGWLDRAQQIGQSGKTVSPKLYIACGISGAMQHVCGIADCDCLIAINKDPDAPIFGAAHYGIAGDLFEILPVMTAEIKKLKTPSIQKT